MTSKPNWPRIWEIFEQAIDRPADERAAWLEQQCAGDSALLREIEGLLAAHQTGEGILERSVQPLAAEALNEPGEISSGQQIGPYRILAELGRGGMGVVYKAEDTRLERTVALKFLAPHLVADPEIRARFTREAKAAATLNHPNICTVYEIEEIEGRTFISMAYIDGHGLDERIKQSPLKLSEALDIASQVGEGLAEAHSQGIVHRDVKPGNVMVKAKERTAPQAIIMDFGLARLVRRSTITRVGTRVGTVSYMSPEQTEGSKVDHRADIWALGVVLYEMVSGLPPFRGEYDEAVLYSILNEDPEPLTGVRAGLPVELDWIVSKALSKSPQERYQTIDEFVTDLRRLAQRIESGRLKALTPRSTPPLTSASAAALERPRWKTAAWLSLLAATGAICAALGWWAARAPRPRALTASDFQLTRITRDAGLATTPSLSPDGSLVAFASDRAGQGNLDIWLQQTSLGGVVRLTGSDADEHEPVFSPDGSRIVYRSEADGGALYIIPVLGGDARLVARNGRGPSFSPDGSLIAFYVAAPGTFEEGKLFVVPPNGGVARPLQSKLESAAMPVFAPDGKHIVFWGKQRGQDFDLWVTSLDESTLQKLDAVEPLRRQNLRLLSLDAWVPDTSRLILSGIRAHSVNLWQLPVSTAGWKIAGPAARLTFGADEREASAIAGGRYAFSSASRRINVWNLPLASSGETPAGPPERLTTGDTADIGVDISADGKRLVYRTNRAGSTDVWMMELPGGTPRQLTATPDFESMPRITPDGSKVAFSVIEQGRRLLSVVPAQGGSPELVCDDCGNPQAWLSPTKILFLRNEPAPASIFELDTATGQKRPLLQHSEIPVYVCNLSADRRWLVFKGDLGALRTKIFAAPVPGDGPVLAESWVPVTGGDAWDDLPRWAGNGRLIYFFSDRDGFRCIWARRFDPAGQHPTGDIFAIRHFHQISPSLSNLSLSEFELDAAPNKLVFPLAETSGDIWMITPVSPATPANAAQ
jgi:serine/threonine protein kinase/Tol biopolymer transport system component